MALGEFRGEEVAKYGWNWGFFFEKSELQNTSRGHFAVDIDLLKPWVWLQKSHLHQGLDWKGLLARRVEMKMKIRPGLKKYTRFHWLFFHPSYPFIQKKWAKDVCLKGFRWSWSVTSLYILRHLSTVEDNATPDTCSKGRHSGPEWWGWGLGERFWSRSRIHSWLP